MKYSKIIISTVLITALFTQSCDPAAEIEAQITEILNSAEFTDISESMTGMTESMDQVFSGAVAPAPGGRSIAATDECLPEIDMEELAEDGSYAKFSIDFSNIASSCDGLETSGMISMEVTGYIAVETRQVPDLDGKPGDMIDKEVIAELDITTATMVFTDFTIESRTMNGQFDVTYGVVGGKSQMTITTTDLVLSNNESDISVELTSAEMVYDWAAELSSDVNPLETDFVLSSTAFGTRAEDGVSSSFSEETIDAEMIVSCFDEDIFLPQSGSSVVTIGSEVLTIDYSATGDGSGCDAVVTLTAVVDGNEVTEEVDLAD